MPIVLNNPADGQTRRFAGYTVIVHWPEIRVRSERPHAQDVMKRVLRNGDVRCIIRPERVNHFLSGSSRSRSVYRCGTSLGLKNSAWCGCRTAPEQEALEPEPPSQETSACDPSVLRYGVDAIQSISLTLHLPVEEAFELTSPPLK